MAPLLLDVSRTLARSHHSTPTGIDRVESAYLEWAGRGPKNRFLARIGGHDHVCGIKELRAALACEAQAEGTLTAAQFYMSSVATDAPPQGCTYVNVSQSNLKPRTFKTLAAAGMTRFVAMVHDTIPLDLPQLCRSDQVSRSRARLTLIAQHADVVLAVSHNTAERFALHAHALGRVPEITVASPGVNQGNVKHNPTNPGYFVALGTIEPRKNIGFLLQLWEKMAEATECPKLHIVGQRGWEHKSVLDELDKQGNAGAHVIEHSDMSDREVTTLMAGARALLFPTLAEGFGLPLYEARAMGLPVIASDLEVLKEHGTALTTYLDPADHDAWIAAIKREMQPGNPQPVPGWDDHFAQVETHLVQQ